MFIEQFDNLVRPRGRERRVIPLHGYPNESGLGVLVDRKDLASKETIRIPFVRLIFYVVILPALVLCIPLIREKDGHQVVLTNEPPDKNSRTKYCKMLLELL